MTTPTEGIGQQYPQPDPRGRLVFDYLPAQLQNAEDSTQAADSAHSKERNRSTFIREATDAERILLQHIGFTNLPAELHTRVTWTSEGVRNRTWPQLDGTT